MHEYQDRRQSIEPRSLRLSSDAKLYVERRIYPSLTFEQSMTAPSSKPSGPRTSSSITNPSVRPF
ncbi:hypothetical protein MBTS_16255 [Methylobacterium bullatum]|nr:hypothetical protein [Methylobacterium bullatum]